MNGSLSPGSLLTVLRRLSGRTGLLHVSRDPDPLDFDWRAASREHRALLLNDGEVLCAESDVRGEQLGPRLLRAGLVDEAGLEAARARGGRLGPALMAAGLDRDVISGAVADQIEEILVRALHWTSGRWRFEELALERPPVVAGATTRELMLRALRCVHEPEVLAELLGDRSSTLVPRAKAEELTTLALEGVEAYLLTRADGSTTAEDILAIAPVDRPRAERALAVLLGLGLVERVHPMAAAQRPVGVRPPAPTVIEQEPTPSRPVQDVPLPAPARPTTAPGANWGYPPPARPAAELPRLSPAAFRRLVNDAHRGHEQKDHYAFLGVARSASAAEIEGAYEAMAARFRPDDNRDGSLHDLRDKLVALYIRAGEAHAVLVDDARRGRYDADLGRSEYERQLALRQAATAAAEPPPPPVSRLPEGEIWIRRAEELLAQDATWDAIQVLEQFLPIAEDPWLRRCRLMLAAAYLKNPRWARQAESLLKPILDADPNDVEALVLSARSCRGWARPRATTLLERALKLRPDHPGARAELQAIQASA